MQWRFTFMEMVFPDDIDPLESWEAYLEEVTKEAGAVEPEALEVMKERVRLEEIELEYTHSDYDGYRFWRVSLAATDLDEGNHIMVYDVFPLAPLLDWLQSVIVRNPWGSDWQASAFLLGEDNEMFSSTISMDANGTIHSTNSIGSRNSDQILITHWEPGYWRAKA